MAFLLNSQAQGVSSNMNNLSKHHGARPPEARGPMQPHRLHRLKASPAAHIIMMTNTSLQIPKSKTGNTAFSSKNNFPIIYKPLCHVLLKTLSLISRPYNFPLDSAGKWVRCQVPLLRTFLFLTIDQSKWAHRLTNQPSQLQRQTFPVNQYQFGYQVIIWLFQRNNLWYQCNEQVLSLSWVIFNDLRQEKVASIELLTENLPVRGEFFSGKRTSKQHIAFA